MLCLQLGQKFLCRWVGGGGVECVLELCVLPRAHCVLWTLYGVLQRTFWWSIPIVLLIIITSLPSFCVRAFSKSEYKKDCRNRCILGLREAVENICFLKCRIYTHQYVKAHSKKAVPFSVVFQVWWTRNFSLLLIFFSTFLTHYSLTGRPWWIHKHILQIVLFSWN